MAEIVSKAGCVSYEKKLLGITAMQKRLGKARFEEPLGGKASAESDFATDDDDDFLD